MEWTEIENMILGLMLGLILASARSFPRKEIRALIGERAAKRMNNYLLFNLILLAMLIIRIVTYNIYPELWQK